MLDILEDGRVVLPIKTARGYRATLQEIERLMAAGAGTPEGELLDVLVTLVEAYERKHFPMDHGASAFPQSA